MNLNGFSRLAMVAAMMAAPAQLLAEDVKIGFVTTLTTGAAVIGNDMKNAVDLAMDHLGGMAGETRLEVIYGDDQFAPDAGKQVTDKLVKQDNVDFVAGYIWSHVLLASRKSVLDAGKFLISANAGPSQIAGKLCDPHFFSTSWQNDQTPMAMGEVLNRQGVQSLYIMAPNYAAGKDMAAGVERVFEGEIKGKDLTKWGADAQLDFSAELAKAKASGANGLFVFYPGAAGGAFIKQYHQAGLKDVLPLYSVFTVDGLSLPKLQEADFSGVLGSKTTNQWDPSLDNEANKKFVSDFKAKYGGYPSFYAAQSYDAIMLIASAVEAVGGDMSDPDAVQAALKSADFASVRGDFSFGSNNMPVQDFFLREVVVDADGTWTTKVVETVYEDHVDSYAAECKM
ncbi:amino acid/amide ABC transporter substrate-binding protein (HAAT family) [Primorskyibacter sedentarius]|uniref:Amino acid/amide ABC transporter substrate-binding protein (HAAT family) n=1 Tax=Primorskyibacter sedentarius TaxID=745311 RepID=A0A4R3JL38_9RHOB|nr:ABC transporter substrate-binding protein [Primorskyibacter sedentarius]TCS67047.1 amino acid/amide ABC transporter substrate-binding protein (HAAT family) [Primorskyibacter sedentarius]